MQPDHQQSKLAKIQAFDPSGVGTKGANLFGLPFTTEEAEVVIIPVPWEVTVSYSAGTAKGPQAVFDASLQMDLYDAAIPDAWKLGIAMDEIDSGIASKSEVLRGKATEYIAWLEEGNQPEGQHPYHQLTDHINQAGVDLKNWLKERAGRFMDQGKLVGLLGGDHSTPLGLMEALAARHEEFGVLHNDAHADLRHAYEGFTYSHASIFYNALKIPQISRIVQVGIRDMAESEAEVVERSNLRVMQYPDALLREQQYAGRTWAEQCEEIIFRLPDHVYISFDIDGLDPKLCPNTGTPVPGGFEFNEVVFLIKQLAASGKKIIGFDLVEVAPGHDDWNGNVGARLLYRLCNLMAVSQKKLNLIQP